MAEKITVTEITDCYLNESYGKYDFTEATSSEKLYCLKLTGSDRQGVLPCIPNIIRRIGISEIPIYAPEPKIIKNHSQYDSEVLLDRLQFITVSTQYIKEHNLDKLEFQIDAIYESDKKESNIKKVYLYDVVKCSESPDVSMADIFPHNMLLFTLRPCEYVSAVFTLNLGTGLKHSKWTVGMVTYKFETQSTANDVNKRQQAFTRVQSPDGNPKSVLMNFESYDKIDAIDMFKSCVNVIREKLTKFRQLVIDYSQSMTETDVKDKIVLVIPGETHTLGNYLESMFINIITQYCKNDTDKLINSLVYYQRPDETIDLIIFSMKLYNENVVDFILQNIDSLTDFFTFE